MGGAGFQVNVAFDEVCTSSRSGADYFSIESVAHPFMG